MENKYFCWDLDETLGFFEPVMYTFFGENKPDHVPDISLRPGILELLSSIKLKNYQNFITTAAGSGYAKEALKQTNIRHFFEEVFYNSIGHAKRYTPVIEYLGIDVNQARESLIVIGDKATDIPADVDGLVFIHQEEGYRFHADAIESLISELLSRGDGKFNTGFERIKSGIDKGQPFIIENYNAQFGYRQLRTGNTNEINIPTIYVSPKFLV